MADDMRLDKWLWYARLVKTRSLVAKLCAAGAVLRDGAARVKPASTVRVGDRLTVTSGTARRFVAVVALGTRRGPAAEARLLYDEIGVEPVVRHDAAWISLFTED